MGENHQYWQGWAKFLQHWGLRAPASTVLENAGPLTVIIAQLIYFGQPLLGQTAPGNQWQALANLLEDRSESRSFAAFLREEEPR
jgi:hypothetical protein